MKCARSVGVVLVLTAVAIVNSMPPNLTITTRSPPPLGETIKHLSKQLTETNATDNVVLDTRTPPKIKIHKKKDKITTPVENSHAGVAIPIDEESIVLEESTKKMNFYKIERPTTNSGLSTWILLSGQAASTTAKSPTIEKKNMTVIINENINKINKPLFKKRSTTTRRPPVTHSTTTQAFSTSQSVSSSIYTTSNPKEMTKFTKIKASILTNAMNKKTTNATVTLTTPIVRKAHTTPRSAIVKVSPSMSSKKDDRRPLPTTTSSAALTVEAKEGETDLPASTNENKKNKKTNKRKKNKNRRRKPSDKGETGATKVEQNKNKEKPISTQLYNYLSREIMPTVGVGLVGLMVTAGLASYFLYPFGIARRSFEVDRKDKEGTYYYRDEYSGGIAEEEAIGKVIAGMVSNTLFPNSYKHQSSSNYPTVRYKQVEQQPQRPQQQQQPHTIQGTVEDVHLTSPGGNSGINNNYEDNYIRRPAYQPTYQHRNYNKDVMEQNKETSYTIADQKYGGVQNSNLEEVTPVVVPEHGPRNIRRRRKRSNPEENEVDSEIFYTRYENGIQKFEQYQENPVKESTSEKTLPTTDGPEFLREEDITSTPNFVTTLKEREDITTVTPAASTTTAPAKDTSLLDVLADLLILKIRTSLNLLHNTTQSIADYVTKVKRNFEGHYQNYTVRLH